MAVLKTGERQLSLFADQTNRVIEALSGMTQWEDMAKLKQIIERVKRKVDDFYREDRKLNIGVIGRVKAGKSSFLNTLLFGGEELLPKASTPKTAVLTRIEYAQQNAIEIEYYTQAEWDGIRQKAQSQEDNEYNRVARELVHMAGGAGIDVNSVIQKKTEKKTFDTYEGLSDELNNYVGDNGKYTPVVKSVTLYLNDPKLQELMIVDTPGLNDPVPARTVRTREFMELCDVVFFLSPSGQFMDAKDWELLSSQLPQEGVKKLALIASKYDNAVCDILREPGSGNIFDDDDDDDDGFAHDIPTACRIVREKLGQRAKEIVDGYESTSRDAGESEGFLKTVKQCKTPIFASSMAWNMASRQNGQFNGEEQMLYNRLITFSNAGNIREYLNMIGNFAEVERIFREVTAEKDQILENKEKTMLADAQKDLLALLENFKEKANMRLSLLEKSDMNSLTEQKKEVQRRMGKIKANMEEVFANLGTSLESGRANAGKALREETKDYLTLKNLTGTITKTKVRRGGFLWLKKYYDVYEEHYTYCLAADALEKIQKYTAVAVNLAEEVFTEALCLKKMKQNLLDVVVKTFPMGDKDYDASIYRILVSETVSGIQFPTFQVQMLPTVVQRIMDQFTGELTTAQQKNELANELRKAIEDIQEELIRILASSVKDYRRKLEELKQKFQSTLLEQVEQEFRRLLEECQRKEQELENYRVYMRAVQKQIDALSDQSY